MWNNQEYYFSIIAQTQVYSRSSNSISKVCVMKHSCVSLPPVFPSICFFTLVLPHLPPPFSSFAPSPPPPTPSLSTHSSLLLALLIFLSRSPPLQPARAAGPVWCQGHWTAVPGLHAHLYVSGRLLFGRRIRAQDLQVRRELDGEASSVRR